MCDTTVHSDRKLYDLFVKAWSRDAPRVPSKYARFAAAWTMANTKLPTENQVQYLKRMVHAYHSFTLSRRDGNFLGGPRVPGRYGTFAAAWAIVNPRMPGENGVQYQTRMLEAYRVERSQILTTSRL